jgi:hypothetical protein
MKILHVYGFDYEAITFEQEIGVDALKGSEDELISKLHELELSFSIHEFGEVDPKFIEFVKSNQDYDNSKHQTFYVFPE